MQQLHGVAFAARPVGIGGAGAGHGVIKNGFFGQTHFNGECYACLFTQRLDVRAQLPGGALVKGVELQALLLQGQAFQIGGNGHGVCYESRSCLRNGYGG